MDQPAKTVSPALTISERLARHVALTAWDDIPSSVVQAAKKFGLDTLAVAWAGANAPGVAEARALLVDEGGKPESTVWAGRARIPACSAAFINSTAAAALDYDGMRATERGSVHSDSVVLPAALAIAERERASGREFLAAVILGNDVVTRLGAASELPHKGWYHTSIYGIFGAAAAAARLLRLDPARTTHAFGLALNQVSATQLPNISRNLTKRFSSSFSARAGAFAALLARQGITAPREAFEGRFGFYDLYQAGDPEILFSGLGKTFPHVETAIKKYSSCACNHAAIEASLQLVREYDLGAADISEVAVTISPYVNRLVGAHFEPGDDPQVAAQFSVQYSVACALLRKRFTVADIRPEAVLDPVVGNFARSVKVEVDESWGNKRGAKVSVGSRRHGAVTRLIPFIPGSAESPITADDLAQKMHDCLRNGDAPLSERQAQSLIDRLNYVEGVPDMSRFFDGIR